MRASIFTLDENAVTFFGAPYVHLLVVESTIIGRFGRRGSLKGTLDAAAFNAAWTDGVRRGWIAGWFNADGMSFHGNYGVGSAGAEPLGSLRGEAKRRRRPVSEPSGRSVPDAV